MNRLTALLLNGSRWIYSRRKPSASALPYFFAFEKDGAFPKCDYQGQSAGDYIKKRILDDQPCMICRFGATELVVLLTYLNMLDNSSFLTKSFRYVAAKQGWFWSYHVKKRMWDLSGIFPGTDSILCRFAELMLDDIKNIDVLGSWFSDEPWLKEKYFPDSVTVPLGDLEPYYHENPWSEGLHGKKVLVIHPFAESIQKQYAKRRLLFKDKRVLPDFELITLKAVQALAGQYPAGFKDYFEALDFMRGQILGTSFDIAIIGAGGYGLSLAAFIKKMGKKAVHLGGSVQILFGIRGKRWEAMPFFQGLFNEHWTRPLLSETPSGSTKVEEACYW